MKYHKERNNFILRINLSKIYILDCTKIQTRATMSHKMTAL